MKGSRSGLTDLYFHADVKNALDEVYTATNTLETKFPEFIVTGDFKQANLNAFYAQFEQNASGVAIPNPIAPVSPVPSVTASEVRSIFLGVNPRKVTGPDGLPGRTLRSSADQLAFTDIFNLSLLQAEVPTCFKQTTIIPGPEKAY
eukprot:g27453.t1